MELIDHQCPEDLKSKFLAWQDLNFFKYHMLHYGIILNIKIKK